MGDLLLIQVSAALFATKVVTFAAGPNGWGFDQRYHFEIKSSVVSLTETNSPRSPRCWGWDIGLLEKNYVTYNPEEL